MFEHAHIGEHPKSSQLLKLPSVSVLGWIPLWRQPTEFPEELREYSQQPWVRMLFETGNVPPPKVFTGRQEFEQYLLRFREFRGAAAIATPQLSINKAGKIVGVSFEPGAKVGFTPLRKGGVTYYSPGTGSHDHKISMQSDQVSIDLWLRFKIGQLGDLAGRLLTGHRAPSALIRIIYIFSQEQVHIHVFGSQVPSFNVYIDWQETCSHSRWMPDELDEFIHTGRCTDAKLSAIYAAKPPW